MHEDDVVVQNKIKIKPLTVNSLFLRQRDEVVVSNGGLASSSRTDEEHGNLVRQVDIQEERLTSRLDGRYYQITELKINKQNEQTSVLKHNKQMHDKRGYLQIILQNGLVFGVFKLY